MATSLMNARSRAILATALILVAALALTGTEMRAQHKQSPGQSAAVAAKAGPSHLKANLHSATAAQPDSGFAARTRDRGASNAEAHGGQNVLRVGATIETGHLHVVTRPGLYGIGAAPRGSAYGIVDERLVRFDPDTMQIQSVIRMVETILD